MRPDGFSELTTDPIHTPPSAPEESARTLWYSPHEPPAGSQEWCRSFDELLALLENEPIETITFGPGVSRHEVGYIARWARIFRPTVDVLTPQASEAAVFAGPRI